MDNIDIDLGVLCQILGGLSIILAILSIAGFLIFNLSFYPVILSIIGIMIGLFGGNAFDGVEITIEKDKLNKFWEYIKKNF